VLKRLRSLLLSLNHSSGGPLILIRLRPVVNIDIPEHVVGEQGPSVCPAREHSNNRRQYQPLFIMSVSSYHILACLLSRASKVIARPCDPTNSSSTDGRRSQSAWPSQVGGSPRIDYQIKTNTQIQAQPESFQGSRASQGMRTGMLTVIQVD
jgi:hypothetical protein